MQQQRIEQLRKRDEAADHDQQGPAAAAAASPLDRLRQRTGSAVEAQLVLRQLEDLQQFVDRDLGGQINLHGSEAAATGSATEVLLSWVLELTDLLAMKSPVATLELLE